MRHYIAIVHKDKSSDFGISFPDFPGAVTAAPSLDEAVEMAAEALALHVEGMLAEGEEIPPPSSFEQVRAAHRDGMPVAVPLKSDALAQRAQVTLPAEVMRRVDEYAEEWDLTRSGVLAETARWFFLLGVGKRKRVAVRKAKGKSPFESRRLRQLTRILTEPPTRAATKKRRHGPRELANK